LVDPDAVRPGEVLRARWVAVRDSHPLAWADALVASASLPFPELLPPDALPTVAPDAALEFQPGAAPDFPAPAVVPECLWNPKLERM